MSGPFWILIALVLGVLCIVGLIAVVKLAPWLGAIAIALLTWACIAAAVEIHQLPAE